MFILMGVFVVFEKFGILNGLFEIFWEFLSDESFILWDGLVIFFDLLLIDVFKILEIFLEGFCGFRFFEFKFIEVFIFLFKVGNIKFFWEVWGVIVGGDKFVWGWVFGCIIDLDLFDI